MSFPTVLPSLEQSHPKKMMIHVKQSYVFLPRSEYSEFVFHLFLVRYRKKNWDEFVQCRNVLVIKLHENERRVRIEPAEHPPFWDNKPPAWYVVEARYLV